MLPIPVVPYPLTNGVRHSWASIEVRVAGQIITGIKSVNYSRTRSRSIVQGTSPDPLGKTRGKNEYKGDMEVYLAEFSALQVALGALGYGDQFFDVVVSYSENGFTTIVDTLVGCTFDSTDASNSEGTDATARKVELNPLKILFNGLDDSLTPLVGLPL